MKPTVIAITAIISASVLSAPPSLASEAEALAVPGTQVLMPPPPNFVLSDRFSGFEDSYSGSTILIVEMPTEAFRGLAEGLTVEALAERGIVQRERREEALGDLPAVWISGTQKAGKLDLEKRLLLIGGPVTVLVTATIPKAYANPPRLKTIEKAMRAARLAESREAGLALLPFRFEEVEGFRFARTLAGRAAVLVEQEPLAQPERPAVFIVSMPLTATCAEYEGQEEVFSRRVLGRMKDVTIAVLLSSRAGEGFRVGCL